MAKAKPMDDLISRQALLDEINEEIEYGEEHFRPENEQINKGLKIARKLVRAAPSVDNGWISVKDRLPPYGERVLVVNEAYETERGYTKYNCGVTVREPHLDFTFWGHKVTHWQPLPKPPKGE